MKSITMLLAILLFSISVNAQKLESNITLKKIDTDENINIASVYSQKAYTLFTVWASWCVTCKEELRILEEYQSKHSKKLNIYTVSIDSKLRKSKKYVRKNKIGLPVLWDPDQKFINAIKLSGVPALALVDKDGQILEKFRAFDKTSTLETISKRIK